MVHVPGDGRVVTHRFEVRRAAQSLHLEQRAGPRPAVSIAAAVDGLASHQVAEFGLGVAADGALRDTLAVAKHDCLPADAIALVELVSHEQHGDALALQLTNHANQVIDFAARQRGGRLVHDDELGLRRDGSGDRHELAHGQRQAGDQRVEESVGLRQVDRLQRLARRPVEHRAIEQPGQTTVAPHELLRQSDVLRDGHVRDEREILVDRLDAGSQRLDGGERRMRLAFETDAAFIRRLRTRDDLDERALAAAVLAQQVIDLAALDDDIDAAQRVHAAEPLVDARQLQKRRRIRFDRSQFGEGHSVRPMRLHARVGVAVSIRTGSSCKSPCRRSPSRCRPAAGPDPDPSSPTPSRTPSRRGRCRR